MSWENNPFELMILRRFQKNLCENWIVEMLGVDIFNSSRSLDLYIDFSPDKERT